MNKINLQSGRSMIEMLGVLAIIGVLSVGGIMGYSKAMFRYKINKTIEQITYIAGNARTTFANQGNYQGLTVHSNAGRALLKKAHIVPEDMWKEEYDYPRSVWDGDVWIGPTTKNSADTANNKVFYISYTDIPEEACIELLVYDWRNAQVKVVATEDYEGGEYNLYAASPVPIDDAVKMCELANVNNTLKVTFVFEADTSSYWKGFIDDTTATLAGS